MRPRLAERNTKDAALADDLEAEAALHGQRRRVALEDAVPLPRGRVYLYQLIGLRVKTTDGATLGTLVDVLDTRANDVYIVHDGSREILLPAIPEVIKEINLERGEMIVELMDGLV